MAKKPTTKVTNLLSQGEFEQAYDLIRHAYSVHKTRKGVAKALGDVSFSVLREWLQRLADAGYKDPREGLTIARHGRRVATFEGNGVSVAASKTAAAVRARSRGEKLADIAKKIGVSESSVSRKVRGVPKPARV